MHFDSTITLGNLLTIAALLYAALRFVNRVDLKLKLHDAWIAAHQKCNDRQIAILSEVRVHLAFLRGRTGIDEPEEDGE